MEEPELASELAALRRDYSMLSPRIRELQHTVSCDCEGITLHLHYPSFRQGQATLQELTDSITQYLIPFTLPRSDVTTVEDLYGKVAKEEFLARYNQLADSARRLFKRANEATNRNGEAGELLLYLLTEWILAAPQIIAKMSLKTNREMPVHGADGVHIRYCPDTKRLLLYWGESKLYSDVTSAITAAIGSIIDALDPEKMQHEIDLVKRNIDFSGLAVESKKALLRYLDPFEESYNERHDVITCLIGFDFEAYGEISPVDASYADKKFSELAIDKLQELAPQVAEKTKASGLAGHQVEIFLFPVPSIQLFRDLFQDKIGWKK